MRAGGPARTVALRACISMREGRLREETREGRTWKEGQKRGGLEVQEQEDKGKKTGKKDFSNFLCVLSSFPDYPRNVGRLSVLLRVAP